jgi:hypothetical protein
MPDESDYQLEIDEERDFDFEDEPRTPKMKDIQQYTCPKCGMVGANSIQCNPLCHVCNFKIKMLPSKNGRIRKVMKAVTVRFSAIFETKIFVDSEDDIDDAVADIEIPESEDCKYVSDTYNVESVKVSGEIESEHH